MERTHYHLAEFNVARTIAPLEHPMMADFVAQLDAVNALAEATPGFVWRLKAEGGGASSYLRVEGDPLLLINMSVWESIEALHGYAYRSDHAKVFRDRRKWFEPFTGPQLVMWWIPAGTIPSVEEGRARLRMLADLGPTPRAFTFKQTFAPSADAAQPLVNPSQGGGKPCPA